MNRARLDVLRVTDPRSAYGRKGKLGTVGLAAAIFIPWMNISGSVLANYRRKKPAK